MSNLSLNIQTQQMDYKLIQEVKMGKPLDFSFRKIRTLNVLKNDVPRTYRLLGVPKRGPNKKYKTAAFWLNHNNLSDLSGLQKVMNDQLELPMYLFWLDVSNNELKYIDQELLHFKHMKILYLHGNHIKNIEEVSKLKPLQRLQTLTLYGNPISRMENYRRYVLFYLPQIRTLDFSPITLQERNAVPPIDCKL